MQHGYCDSHSVLTELLWDDEHDENEPVKPEGTLATMGIRNMRSTIESWYDTRVAEQKVSIPTGHADPPILVSAFGQRDADGKLSVRIVQ